MTCPTVCQCDGVGLVCEDHPDKPWEFGANPCICMAAGQACACSFDGCVCV